MFKREVTRYTRTTGVRHLSSKKQKRYQSLAQPSSIQTIDTNELQETKRSIWRKQFVLDHFSIPGKYQKFFTGRLRKREQKKYERQLMDPIAKNSLLSEDKGLNRISSHAGGRNMVTLDEELQLKKMEMLRAQILRILERHLSSEQLPVKQLSLQYWEITDVLVSFNLRTAVCCYKVTVNKGDMADVKPFQIRHIVKESAEYLNMVVNQELAKSVSRNLRTPQSIRLRFTNGTSTTKLLEKLQQQQDEE